MSEKTILHCEVCGSEMKPGDDNKCLCEGCKASIQGIEELPVCTAPASAENARVDHIDEPCDDGRGGKL